MGNAPIQMGLKTDKQSYQHGETMTGTVYISVTSVTPAIQNYQGIRLQFAGNENTEVRVEEKSGDTTTYRTVRESSSILRVEVPMTTFSSPLRVAKYEFPFEWKLPDTPLPSSFRHKVPSDRKGHCEVKYTLSAYLVPQEQTGFFGGPTSSGTSKNSASCASQTIHFVGAPTRSIPEPINLAEERTAINGFCCCWKQGHVSLGFEASTVVMTPEAPCQLQIWGSNSSALPIQGLRVQLIQSVKWQSGNDFNTRHTRSHNATLVDYNLDVAHLPQWDPVRPSNRNQDYQAVQQQADQQQQANPSEDIPQQPVATSFQVPPDVMDSYQGINCSVEHTLIVSATTRLMATTPQISYTVHIQRMTSPATASSLPVATAWMEEAEYQDICLPSDWAPDEKVPVIHLTEITTLDNTAGSSSLTTAQAVVVPPVNPSAGAYPNAGPAGAAAYPGAVSYRDTAPTGAAAYPNSAPTGATAAYPSAAAYPNTAPTGAAAYPSTTAYPNAAPTGAYPNTFPVGEAAKAAPSEDYDFARPAGMTDEITTTAPLETPSGTDDLHQVQAILRQIDPNDVTTHRRVEHQLRSMVVCQRVLSTMTPEDYQYLCQAGTPLTISRIAIMLAMELNKLAGFRGAFLVALMQLPVAQETSVSLIGSLTEQISDLEESAEFVEQNLRPEDAKWFKQRVDDWAY